jgi:hypothetical protein
MMILPTRRIRPLLESNLSAEVGDDGGAGLMLSALLFSCPS